MSIFICYIDESGTPDIPGTSSHFILAGVAFHAKDWKSFDAEIGRLKAKWGLENKELHTAWMLRDIPGQKHIPDFEKLNFPERIKKISEYQLNKLYELRKGTKDPVIRRRYNQYKKDCRCTKNYIHLTLNERKSIIENISNIVGGWKNVHLFAECINKIHFIGKMPGKKIDEIAFENLISRFQIFLDILSKSKGEKFMGLLVQDNNPTISTRLTELMLRFHKAGGTLWTKVQNIIETPLFVDSKLTSMVQIADLCSYALRRYLENNETRLFDNIYKRADKKDGKVVGVRHFTKDDCKCKICTSRK